ncbi:MAG: gephyrin-like molybdotransferase Glp [Candidatus Puniceispirillaceae bacterium]
MMEAAIRYEVARDRLNDAFHQVAGTQTIPVRAAYGRISATTIKSPLSLPETDNAAVDGYCVSSAFLSDNPDYDFPVIGEAKAGHPFDGTVSPGQAVRIFTGAIMPKGADCVMMQEFCVAKDNHVRFSKPMAAGKNARPAGENLALGEQIIQQGDIISPVHIAQLAAIGQQDISVMRPLRVGVLSTGDELVNPQAEVEKPFGHIFDTNRPLITALIEQAGHLAIDGGIIRDDATHLAEAYTALSKSCDMVISSGGASQGVEDHTQSALSSIGATSLFWRVAMKPGRPVAAAKFGQIPIFALPGNPVAVFVCYKLFVAPLLDKLSHGHFPHLKKIMLPVGFSATKPVNERAEFVRVKLALTKSGETVMVPHGRKGAGVLSSLTGADGLAELPFEADHINEGQKVPFIMI